MKYLILANIVVWAIALWFAIALWDYRHNPYINAVAWHQSEVRKAVLEAIDRERSVLSSPVSP